MGFDTANSRLSKVLGYRYPVIEVYRYTGMGNFRTDTFNAHRLKKSQSRKPTEKEDHTNTMMQVPFYTKAMTAFPRLRRSLTSTAFSASAGEKRRSGLPVK